MHISCLFTIRVLASPRCRGGGVRMLLGVSTPGHTHSSPSHTHPTTWKALVPEIPIPWKGHGIRDTISPLDRMSERRLWKHYLPATSSVDGNYVPTKRTKGDRKYGELQTISRTKSVPWMHASPDPLHPEAAPERRRQSLLHPSCISPETTILKSIY